MGGPGDFHPADDTDLNEDAGRSSLTRRKLRPIQILLLGIVVFIALESWVFRSGVYARIVEPDSYAGQFELICCRELARADIADERLAIFLGDSRVAEGFSEKIADARLAGKGDNLRFVNASMAGSTLRTWFYLLQEIDPDGDRYDVVILPFLDYEETGTEGNPNNRILDLRFVASRIKLQDALPFTLSFENLRLRFEALRGTIFKGFLFRDDLTDLLAHWTERQEKAELVRQRGAEFLYDYEGKKQTMEGTSIDQDGKSLVLPKHATEFDRKTLSEDLLKGPLQPTKEYHRYYERWLLPILKRYDETETIVLGVRMPRGPLPRPWDTEINRQSVVRRATADGSITLLDEDLFSDLETPQTFADSVHMNGEGRAQFSRRIADQVAAILEKDSDR